MKFKLIPIFFVVFTLTSFLLSPLFAPVMAQGGCSIAPSSFNPRSEIIPITISGLNISNFSQVGEVLVYSNQNAPFAGQTYSGGQISNLGGGSISLTIVNRDFAGLQYFTPLISDRTKVEVKGVNGNTICFINDIPFDNSLPGGECSITISPNPPKPDEFYTATVNNLPTDASANLYIDTTGTGAGWVFAPADRPLISGKAYTQDPKSVNTHVYFQVIDYNISSLPICTTDFVVGTTPAPNQDGDSSLGTTQICNFISDSVERSSCEECFGRPGVWTPFRCIETDPQKFVEKILKIAIGIAGGIAFLMIIYGAFVTMMSSGNPEKLTEGREIITSAIAGLLLIVFSVVILRIIGVDILGIPGLG